MTAPTEDLRILRDYLLGRLDEARASQVEERYFGETGAFDLISSALDDLTDEYVRGELTPDDRQRFERLHVSDASGRSRAAFARTLARGVRRPAPPARPSFLRPLLGLVRQQAAPFQLALAAGVALMLLLPAIAVTRVSELGEAVGRLRADVEREREAARSAAVDAAKEREQRRHLEDALASVSTTSFALLPGATRAGGARLVLPARAGFARFELALESVPPPPLHVSIRRAGGATVWSTELQDSVAPAGPVVRVPTMALPPGDYEVIVAAINADGHTTELANYGVRIERR